MMQRLLIVFAVGGWWWACWTTFASTTLIFKDHPRALEDDLEHVGWEPRVFYNTRCRGGCWWIFFCTFLESIRPSSLSWSWSRCYGARMRHHFLPPLLSVNCFISSSIEDWSLKLVKRCAIALLIAQTLPTTTWHMEISRDDFRLVGGNVLTGTDICKVSKKISCRVSSASSRPW